MAAGRLHSELQQLLVDLQWTREDADGVVILTHTQDDSSDAEKDITHHKVMLMADGLDGTPPKFNYYYSYYSEDLWDHEKLERNLSASGIWACENSTAGCVVRLTGKASMKKVFLEKPFSKDNPADEVHKSEDAIDCSFELRLDAAPFQGQRIKGKWVDCGKGNASSKPSVDKKGKRVHYLMIGNPGVGKSTTLNGVAGKALFQSGVSFGGGKTKVLQTEVVGNDIFMDTPGLADNKLREQAAKAITEALKDGGIYKVFFVITLEAGRVKPADRTTMELVLSSAPITQYGVIINKLEEVEKRMLVENTDEARDQVITGLMHGMPGAQSLYFHFNGRDSGLVGKADALMPLDDDFIRFIRQVPSIEIKPEEVCTVNYSQFEATIARLEAALQEIHEDKKMLHKKMDEERVKYQKLKEDMEARMKELTESRRSSLPDVLAKIFPFAAPLTTKNVVPGYI